MEQNLERKNEDRVGRNTLRPFRSIREVGRDYDRPLSPGAQTQESLGEARIRARKVLGPLASRVVIGGYSKADDLLRLNTRENKHAVCAELGLNDALPIVTYAPANSESFIKPGGSLSKAVLNHLEKLANSNSEFHIVVKTKYNTKGKISSVIKNQLKNQ